MYRIICPKNWMFQSTLPTRGSDEHLSLLAAPKGGFQSTLPTRGSDTRRGYSLDAHASFNPRSPRGGATLAGKNIFTICQAFQSTLPTRGSDLHCIFPSAPKGVFQSTLPTRGSDRTETEEPETEKTVSIHAPHEGERLCSVRGTFILDLVSIHAPHEGERRRRFYPHVAGSGVSIHAPHEGERLEDIQRLRTEDMFQSTLPTRGSDGGKVHLYAAFPRIY